jgi:hypothetical protein
VAFQRHRYKLLGHAKLIIRRLKPTIDRFDIKTDLAREVGFYIEAVDGRL